jgi:hypothetical protein
VVFQVILPDSLPSCVTSIHFNIEHDGDVLTYLHSNGTGLTLKQTDSTENFQTQHFTVSGTHNTGAIADLYFKAYLTKSDSTPLVLSNIQFDDTCSLPGPCIASVSSEGSSFRYILFCGGDFIRQFMGSGSFIIDRIVPNPAHDEFTISFTNPGGQPIHYEIDDILGRTITSGESVVSRLSFSARALPEGVLLLRASANGVVETRRFVVAR